MNRYAILALGLIGCTDKGDTVIQSLEFEPTVTIATPGEGAEVDMGVNILITGVVEHDKFEDNLSVLFGAWTANNQPICEDEVYTTVNSGGNKAQKISPRSSMVKCRSF